MTKRILPVVLAGVALVGVAGLGFPGMPASRAQTPVEKPPAAAETLEQKVARLERQVADLQKQIEELKRQRQPPLTLAPAVPSVPFGSGGLRQAQPSVLPPGAKPFEFNGQTYYHIPIQQGR